MNISETGENKIGERINNVSTSTNCNLKIPPKKNFFESYLILVSVAGSMCSSIMIFF